MTTFPLSPSPNGRYLVDAVGSPFLMAATASWDAHMNLSRSDWQSYLSHLSGIGVNAVFTYLANPVTYMDGSMCPWAVYLGGSSAGVSALPFTKNKSGGTWDGDPTFTNFDADFAFPNDSWFAMVAQFVDDCRAEGILCLLAFCYLGYNSGVGDGWYQTLINSANTSAVCTGFGTYLANGHGSFTGFATRPNIIWIAGGDALPANGSTAATRSLDILQGLQANGANQPVGHHWQNNYLPNDQTDFKNYLTTYCSYTHGNSGGSPPTPGPSYPEGLAIYETESPTRPAYLIETTYWGDGGLNRADIRYYEWGSVLACIGGTSWDFSPLWGFPNAGGTNSSATTVSVSWQPSTHYNLSQYIQNSSKWYTCVQSGTTASSGGPTGTGSNITDGSAKWDYAASVSTTMGGVANLLGLPSENDYGVLIGFCSGINWYKLTPANNGSVPVLITVGQGTYATWSDGNEPSNNMDWIVSAADPSGVLLVAYIPTGRSGTFSVDMAAMSGISTAHWIDPTTGVKTSAGTGLHNSGSHSFTTPGTNSGGDTDWVLFITAPASNCNYFGTD